jgi:arylsulfatase A-like enzyme
VGHGRLSVALACVAALGCAGAPDEVASTTTTSSVPPAPLAADALAGMNVVLVLSDALRAASLPWHGYPRDTAPRLAALARKAVVFDYHLAHYPGTPVSVSQMFTSRLMAPLLMSYRYLAVAVRDLPADLLVLPEALREHGYRTILVSSHPWWNDESRAKWFFDDWRVVAPGANESYAPFERLLPPIREALDAVPDGTPFFLYVHSMDTHGPNHLRPEFAVPDPRGDRPEAYAAYDAEIRYTDRWVGALVDELRRRSLWKRTIFVFTSDHGEEFGELGPEPWNASHGLQVRRPVVHVPLVVRLPGDPRPGRHVPGPTGHVDLAPTLLGLVAPGSGAGGARVDGEDLSAVVRGAAELDPGRTEVAWSPRFWAAYGRAGEVHYDPWEDRTTPLLVAQPDANGYPRLVPAAAQDDAAALAAAVRAAFTRRLAEWVALPPNPDLAATTWLAMPMWIDHGAGPPPTFADEPGDGRWALPGRFLAAQPGESPPALTAETPWVPGRYRVRLVLDGGRRRKGWANRARVRIDGGGNSDVAIDGAHATPDGRIDLGVQTIGRVLRLHVTDPVGGVALAGLEIERVDRPPAAAPGAGGLRERLRALGYLAP